MSNKRELEKTVEIQVTETMNTIGAQVASFALSTKGTIETNEFKSGNILQKKTYGLENAIGNRTTLTTTNPEVIRSTELIARAMSANDLTEYVICKELSNLNTPELLSEMGFKSIVEYGKALFGLAPNTIRQYVRIGEIFLSDDYSIKSEHIFVKNKSQLIELLAYVGENGNITEIEQAYKDGMLNGTENQKVFRSKLKEYFTRDEDIVEKDELSTAYGMEVTEIIHEAEPGLIPDDETENKKESNSTKKKEDSSFGYVSKFVANKVDLMNSFDRVKSVISETNLDFTIEEIQDVERAFMIIQQFSNKLVELV